MDAKTLLSWPCTNEPPSETFTIFLNPFEGKNNLSPAHKGTFMYSHQLATEMLHHVTKTFPCDTKYNVYKFTTNRQDALI